eukprot:scaffold117473_cov22-Tisochrysis_lutea.AAC.2
MGCCAADKWQQPQWHKKAAREAEMETAKARSHSSGMGSSMNNTNKPDVWDDLAESNIKGTHAFCGSSTLRIPHSSPKWFWMGVPAQGKHISR